MIIRVEVNRILAVAFLLWPCCANPKNKKHGAPTFVVWNIEGGDLC